MILFAYRMSANSFFPGHQLPAAKSESLCLTTKGVRPQAQLAIIDALDLVYSNLRKQWVYAQQGLHLQMI